MCKSHLSAFISKYILVHARPYLQGFAYVVGIAEKVNRYNCYIFSDQHSNDFVQHLEKDMIKFNVWVDLTKSKM